jgi:hypothetical protein
VSPIGEEKLKQIGSQKIDGGTEETFMYDCPLKGGGRLRLDMLVLNKLGINLASMSRPAIKTLDLPFATVVPFIVMIIASLFTKPNSKKALDRLYVKMKTPVNPDPEQDSREIDVSYAKPDRFDDRKLFPGTALEFQRPTAMDFWGFLACFAICFGIIGLVLWVAQIGA